MNKITLKNIAMDELQLLIKNASFVYSNMSEMELKAAAESEDKILAKTVARQIQPKLEEMQHENIAFPNICEGTQLLNSFETMLILPYQLVNNKFEKNKNSFHLYDYSEEQWQDKFPVLKKYIFCETDYKYSSRYFYLNDKIGKVEQEYPYNPIYVIRHLRNSFSHDRIGIEPINQGKEIESLRFTDKEDKDLYKNKIAQEYLSDFLKHFPKYNGKGYKNSFRLTIKYEDLEKILNEIYTFLNGILEG